MRWAAWKGESKLYISSLNSHFAGFQSGTRYSYLLTLRRFWQFTPTNRTHFIRWLNHCGELAPGAFDGMDFYSFDFVRVKTSHWTSHSQKVLVLVV